MGNPRNSTYTPRSPEEDRIGTREEHDDEAEEDDDEENLEELVSDDDDTNDDELSADMIARIALIRELVKAASKRCVFRVVGSGKEFNGEETPYTLPMYIRPGQIHPDYVCARILGVLSGTIDEKTIPFFSLGKRYTAGQLGEVFKINFRDSTHRAYFAPREETYGGTPIKENSITAVLSAINNKGPVFTYLAKHATEKGLKGRLCVLMPQKTKL